MITAAFPNRSGMASADCDSTTDYDLGGCYPKDQVLRQDRLGEADVVVDSCCARHDRDYSIAGLLVSYG